MASTSKKYAVIKKDNSAEKGKHLNGDNTVIRVCKIIYKISSSHLGLIVLLVAYTFIGAGIFVKIEGKNEREELARKESSSAFISSERREVLVRNVFENVSHIDGATKNELIISIRANLRDFERTIYENVRNGYTIPGTARGEGKWTFWGSVFYCGTIYTTIGYGNVFPATELGRAVTIIYAVLGIPLCLIVLADLGKLLANFFNFCWKKGQTCVTRICSNRASTNVKPAITNGSMPSESAGHGTQTPAITNGSMPSESTGHGSQTRLGGSRTTLSSQQDEGSFHFPFTVAAIIVLLYVLLGAAIYIQWETTWSLTEAIYFIFISIFTIGFGDVLPSHPKYFLISSVYILFGMALIAMAINVLSEIMSKKIEKTAKKISGKVKKTLQHSLGQGQDKKQDAVELKQYTSKDDVHV